MEQYNADELESPEWMNDQFFQDVIRKAQKDPSITLCHGCKLRPGTKAGDHYASVMFRTTVHYRSKRFHQEQAIHLIMKTVPKAEGVKLKMLKDNSLFNTEIKMYGEVLPAMAKVLNEGGERFEYPRLIYAAHEPNTIIILEDVNPMGWIAGQDIGSYEDMLPTIRALAKFHAVSYFMSQTSYDFSTYEATVFTKDEEGALAAIFSGINEFCDAVQTWEGCESFAPKFQKLKHSVKQKLQQVYVPNPKAIGYNVLNHADLHAKNMLHKVGSTGKVTNTMLVDFQCCHWGSPAIDLFSLLDMVPVREVKVAHRNEIIYEYYQHFVEILNKVGFLGSVPTLVDLRIELVRKGFLEVFHDIAFEPFKTIDLAETTIDDIMSGRVGNPALKNEKYQEMIRTDMPILMNKGLLD